MFGVPAAKRIKRSEFLAADDNDDGSQSSKNSSSRAASPSPFQPGGSNKDLVDVNVDYGFEYDFISPSQSQSQSQVFQQRAGPGHENGEEEGQEPSEEPSYQFRLFTTPGTTTTNNDKTPSSDLHLREGQHLIRLSTSPEPATALLASEQEVSLEKAHFVRPHRPESQYYYFTASLPEARQAQLKSQYADVALSTSDVLLNAATTKWPGTAVPWRVVKVTVATKGRSALKKGLPLAQTTIASRSHLTSRKARPSKRRRIHIRRQLAAKSAAKEQQKLSDEAEREKRTRRNREKKVKRKEREKRKRQDAQEAEEAGSK